MSALNASHDLRFKSGSSIERLSCHIDDLTTALTQIRNMPCSMVNDSESLRHTIKGIQAIATTALKD